LQTLNKVGQTANTSFYLQRSVLSSLCYFDVFAHPLTKEEIRNTLSVQALPEELTHTLELLLERSIILEKDGFYFLAERDATIVAARKEKERRAQAAIRRSYRYTRLISRFPFVRGVCISGSLSKGVMEQDGDVDYFVVTDPGRLWLCRSLLILFKKIFLFNSHKYFCTNYFVDANSLLIPDKNIFTATEVMYLKPVVNRDLIEKLVIANGWTKEFLPAFERRLGIPCLKENRNGFKRMLEWVLGGRIGERLDNSFFKLTLKRWQKKFPNFATEDFDLNMRTRKNVSKHHPRGYQQKVLTAHAAKLKKVLRQVEEKMVVAA
jgi:hypothetical protein